MINAKFEIKNVNCPDVKNWYSCHGEVEGVKVSGFGHTHKKAFEEAMRGYWYGRTVGWRKELNKLNK